MNRKPLIVNIWVNCGHHKGPLSQRGPPWQTVPVGSSSTPSLPSLPAIGLLAGTAAVASARTDQRPHRATHSAAAEAKAIAVSEIKKLTVGYHPTDHQVGITSPGFKGLSDVTSTNWSGYADTGSSFSDVSASWTEPGATCSSRTTSLAAFWVGIDGYSSNSVEQDGTMIECYNRTAYQFTWWEMYPTNDVQVVGETAAAGDAITASVVRSGTSYKLTVTDSTHTADSFTTTQTCSASSCVDSSAEWIAEAPTGSSGVEPLSELRDVDRLERRRHRGQHRRHHLVLHR